MPPLTPSLSTSQKLGFIVPSSNTAVESLTSSILQSLPDIIPIFTRIRVLTLGTDPSSLAQFSNPETFTTAAELLADAQPDAILWNGTSGMFTGGTLETDEKLAKAMTEGSKTPCSTTTLAYISALRYLEIKDISIAVPYTPELTERVASFFSKEGFAVHKAACMETTPPSNNDIARTPAVEMKAVIRESVVPGKTKAVLVACTNWPAAPLVAELEEELGVYVLDSVAVTVWEGLRMAGLDGQLKVNEQMKPWGKLLSS